MKPLVSNIKNEARRLLRRLILIGSNITSRPLWSLYTSLIGRSLLKLAGFRRYSIDSRAAWKQCKSRKMRFRGSSVIAQLRIDSQIGGGHSYLIRGLHNG
jgi:hypothetical protein